MDNWGYACRFDSKQRRLFFYDDGGATHSGAGERKHQRAGMSAANVGASNSINGCRFSINLNPSSNAINTFQAQSIILDDNHKHKKCGLLNYFTHLGEMRSLRTCKNTQILHS